MVIFTTLQSRKDATSEAKNLGAGLQKKYDDKSEYDLKGIAVKCPTCKGELEKKSNVYICSNCGETFNANEIM